MLKSYKEFAIARGLVEDASIPGVSISTIIADLEQIKKQLLAQIDSDIAQAQTAITGHVRLSMRQNQGLWSKLKNWWQRTWHGKDREAIEHAGSDNLRIELPGLISLYEHEILNELMDIMETGPINQALGGMTPMLQNLAFKMKDSVAKSIDIMITKLRDIEASGGSLTPGTSTPGTSTPGTSTPGTSTPGTSTPGTSTPGSGDLVADLAAGAFDRASRRRRKPMPRRKPGSPFPDPTNTKDATNTLDTPDPEDTAVPTDTPDPEDTAVPTDTPDPKDTADTSEPAEPETPAHSTRDSEIDSPDEEDEGEEGEDEGEGESEDGEYDDEELDPNKGDEVEDVDSALQALDSLENPLQGMENLFGPSRVKNRRPKDSSTPTYASIDPREFDDDDEVEPIDVGPVVSSKKSRGNKNPGSVEPSAAKKIANLGQQIEQEFPDTSPALKKTISSYSRNGGTKEEKIKLHSFLSSLISDNPNAAEILKNPNTSQLFAWVKKRIATPEDMAHLGKNLENEFLQYPDLKSFKADQQAVLANIDWMFKNTGRGEGIINMESVKYTSTPKPRSVFRGKNNADYTLLSDSDTLESVKQKYLIKLREVSTNTWRPRTVAYDLSHLSIKDQVKYYKNKLKG